MTSKIKYQKNYTEFNETYQLVLPLSLEDLVPDDDSVRLLSHELEELDYTLLYKAYSSKGRNPAVDPKTMFKILTYAYSQNIYSSRKIEQACRRDFNFMWLLAGQKAPDHSTIARFRTGFLAEACEDLFYQMVRRLKDAEELSMETVFIDGSKLEACANKYTFVWKKAVTKNQAKLLIKLADFVAECEQLYDIKIVYGNVVKIKHLKRLRKKLYTLKDAEHNLKFKYKNITADAGYESEENYLFLEANNQIAFIKPANYEISKTRKYKNDIGKIENMEYDKISDFYTCKNNRKLTVSHIRHNKTKTGYVSEKTIYTCENCSDCPYKSDCIKGNNCKTPLGERTKVLQVAKTFIKHRKEDLERIISDERVLYRMNRSIQAEGSFGDIKQDIQFRRYLSKGTANVLAESTLLAIARNINKLHNKIQNGKTGTYLFPLKSA